MTSLFGNKTLIRISKKLLLAASIASNCSLNSVLASPIDHQDAVAKSLEGVMTTSVQVKNDAPEIQVQMTTCRVEVDKNKDSIFLYQEQGIVGSLDKPYRQRFLEIATSEESDNIVYSHSYKPDNLEQWTNFCISKAKTVSESSLGKLVCTVTLKPFLTVYSGTTPPEGCPANVRGAVSITNRIILHQDGMDTWDRGFDESGNQVWGAEDQAYRFRRQVE
jgi:hypothetical protein